MINRLEKIIKHRTFSVWGLRFISLEAKWKVLLSLFFVHHCMEVSLHKNAIIFLAKPPKKCVCAQTSKRLSAPVESASTVEGRLSHFVTFV